ncbi:MAG TPA: hypothetical protein VFY65_12135, partial [Longimicrobium sp.]|nr:hypothetical protein [Longimicrobium sp.]
GHAVVEAGRGYAFALSGKPDQARAAIRRLEALRRSQYVPAAYIALVHAALGEPDPAMEWLERAYQEHDDWVAYLGIEPAFNPLRADPRFRALVRRAQGGP